MRFLLYNDLLYIRMDDLLKAAARDREMGCPNIRAALLVAWKAIGDQKQVKKSAIMDIWLGQIHRYIL
jgi:hypothetical protein